MGSKTKKRGNQQSVSDVFRFAQRAIEKNDFKEALKNAKVCFRQDPTHEHRQILERSWLGRGLQLARAGLQMEGRAAAQELLNMGVLEPDVQQGLPELLLAVGLYDQAVSTGKISDNAQSGDATVLARAADRAVADPASAPASLAGIREGAAMVRNALDLVSAGDEAAALAALGEVPRNSPFAEWRLFVRGLAAYYRRDGEAMGVNWDHLDPQRFAARLAAPLRRLADPAWDSGDPEEFRQAIRVLEKDLCGGPVVWYLESLRTSLRADRWREAVFSVRRWKKEFQSALPGLADRLDRLFYDLAVRNANPRWLNDLTTAIDPPRWDPHWNRARALISENDKEDDPGIESIQAWWLAYIEDIASIPDLKPGEQSLSQAMIWSRLGRLWAEEAEDEDEDEDCCQCDACRREREEARAIAEEEAPGLQRADMARERSIECLNTAIRLAPDFSAAYQTLAGNYVEWEGEDAAAEVHRRLLAQVPDDIDSIVFLFHYCHKRDDDAARDYAVQAHRLKPASDEMLNMLVAGHSLAARVLALKGQMDEARAELAAAAAVGRVPGSSAYDLTVRRAMVEFKAGQPVVGRHWVGQALNESDDPADVYLALAIEAVRHELPFELQGPPLQFRNFWLSSLKKRRSRAAGPMARRLLKFMQENEELSGKYAFLNDYLERVIKYVSGCSRIRWQADDLLHVCHFLDQVAVGRQFRDVRKPLVKFLDMGRKKFPREPEFHVMRGQVEMRRGPTNCNRRLARQCFEMAIETAKTSSHPKAKEIQEIARQSLRLLGRDGGGEPRSRSYEEPEDFAGVPPELFQGRGSREELIDIIKRMAPSMGVDPQEVIDKMLEDLLPRATTKGKK